MEGRWTIHWKSETGDPDGWVTASLSGPGVRVENGPVPVVPCDDAAIERAVASLRARYAAAGDLREIVETVLRAAGETP